MPRPREFDEAVAVEKAMHAFWDHGYEGTSTARLCEATGLSRSSIYNTFSSKHALFRLSLRHYMDSATQRRLDQLAGDRPVRDKIRDLFAQTIDDEFRSPRGCLVVNTAAELGGRDAEVSEDLRRDTERLTAALRDAIEAGRRAGEIAEDKDPLTLARFVHTTAGGLRVMARSGADRAALENVAEVALATL
ncbi:TetR/AcrR family transcriptional regulator [Prauserella endophytica]|uniref:TetR/AcrR family transcriptional regulator n=1 Tax=Prauserella endophytica TaxID=1592324 RepID=A0ABY2S5X0_9PSEU|nr:TetR/AcrR family transcriptional regulator [Prauserella endophytica]PXY30181.1 transcriptional regulator [Prauserella coralliicola]TKG71247.1 TetR/AcrR family transcriptional regulator [Prauserella endophytica]